MADIDRRLSAVAADQRMLIAMKDVYAAGGSSDHADARVHGGRWRRVDRGVFLIAGAPFDWETRLLAAVLAAGDGAIASHLAAARLLGISGFGQALPEVSIPRGRRYRRTGVLTHESTDLDRCSVIQRQGVPLTDANRTVLDLGRYVGVQRLARAVEAARRADLVTWSSLIATLTAHARRGRPGVRRLRAVILAGAHRQEITDTDAELLLLALMLEAGLPEPVLHHRVHAGARFVGEVDLAYPQWKIAIESDGSVHADPEVRARDLRRQNDLILEGWMVLRFDVDRVRDNPAAVLREIRDAISAATAAA